MKFGIYVQRLEWHDASREEGEMRIAITSAINEPTCVLSQWAVSHEPSFVEAIAWLHIQRRGQANASANAIIQQLGPRDVIFIENEIHNASDRLSFWAKPRLQRPGIRALRRVLNLRRRDEATLGGDQTMADPVRAERVPKPVALSADVPDEEECS